jgi:hypothetical protein
MVSFPDLLFLALQIILALGNRPKAERYTYTTSIAVYAFLSAYLIFNTVVLTVKAFCVSLRFLSRLTVTEGTIPCSPLDLLSLQLDRVERWVSSSEVHLDLSSLVLEEPSVSPRPLPLLLVC